MDNFENIVFIFNKINKYELNHIMLNIFDLLEIIDYVADQSITQFQTTSSETY